MTKKARKSLRVILIGGTSHAGKSTLAQAIASQLGWHYLATDSLARHPGRPWREKGQPPEHVKTHYASLSVNALQKNVLEHYDRIWPNVEAIIRRHAELPTAPKLVLEGSALWPAFVLRYASPNVAALWLTAANEEIKARIYQESRFATREPGEQQLIEAFVARSCLYNKRMLVVLKRYNLPCIEINRSTSLETLVASCLKSLY